jgi:protein TonB
VRRALLFFGFTLFSAASLLAADLLTQPPALSHKIAPTYTPQAIQAGIEGAVLVYAEIGVDGRAHRLRVIKGLGYGLDQQAIEAVRRWEFYPGTKNGVPATVPATLQVEFHLPQTRV